MIHVQGIQRLFEQLKSGEGLSAAVLPRRAAAIIRSEVDLSLEIPQASDEMVRRYEEKVRSQETSSGNVGRRTPQPRLAEEDRVEGNIGINIFGSSFEPQE